ncbi:hypothetical protein DBR11_08180 [Pedobacter sp. HMWF019]|uniref:tetratricopeptide repeat protein n=1 Tax=Pedobacter sp. HMWF019 TaxID=2056856 RepID=UPI000D3C57A5|nr:tetratricopeptide repeat protein [Pedobacter sp. HMWF019]PTT01104.1 hypothetical protein DBR11_08180 [Pedobacter sp. HMWF019]
MVNRYLRLLIFILAALGQVYAVQGRAQINGGNLLKRTEQLSRQFPDSAFLLLRKLYATAESSKDILTAGICMQQMGQICFNEGHYAQSLDFYQRAEKIFREQKNPILLAATLNHTGLLYYYNKQNDKAWKHYNQALSLYGKSNDRAGVAETYGNLGHLFEKRQQYDSASFYQNRALAEYKCVGNKFGTAKIYENLGSIYEDLAKYDSAYHCFNTARELYATEHNEVASIEVINNLGDILRKTGKYSEAMKQTRKALVLAQKTNNLYQIGSAYRDIAKTFRLLNQLDSAYDYLELSRKYTMEVYSKEGTQQTSFLQVLYDTDKKNSEIVRLENIRKTNTIIAIATGLVLILLLILVWTIFSRQRLKIRDEKLIARKNRDVYNAQRELMEMELRNKQLEEESLKQELELKTKELTSHTLNLIQNNQLLEEVREKLHALVKDDKRDQKKQLQQIVQQITQSFNNDQHWKEFANIFEQVHQSFYDQLKKLSDDLTSNDIRLLALLKMNLASKDIALLLGISQDSLRIARYRLRKKLNIPTGDNLSTFIQTI